jgi:hypothetical protein
MSNKATLGLGLASMVFAAFAAGPARGQALDWRRVGNAAMDLELAGLATGPVDRVWYSPVADQLLIRTPVGKIFETNDFDRWIAAPADTAAPPVPEGRSITLPEDGAQVRNPAGPSPRVYALGRFVYRSDNSGIGWNLSFPGRRAVVERPQRESSESSVGSHPKPSRRCSGRADRVIWRDGRRMAAR